MTRKRKDKPAANPAPEADAPTKGPAIFAETTSGLVSSTGGNVAPFSAVSAYDYLSAVVASHREATLLLVCAGAVAYIVAAKANAKGARSFKAVDAELRRRVSEHNVRRSMAYGIIATAKQLTSFLDRTYHNGGVVHIIMTAPSAADATAMLIASLKTDHKVTSYNTLRQAITNRDGKPIEAMWDAAAIAADKAAKAERATDTYKRAKGLERVAGSVDLLAEHSDVLPQVFIQAARKAERSIPAMVIPLAQGIMSASECKEIIAAFQARWQTLKEAADVAAAAKAAEAQPAATAH